LVAVAALAMSAVVVMAGPAAAVPTAVSLSTDKTVFSSGQAFMLTATVDAELWGSGREVRLYDQTASTLLRTCTMGVSCAFQASFTTGASHTYVATLVVQSTGVVAATSNTVTVYRSTWTVGLTANKSVFSNVEDVTLTATTNQNVAGSGYQLTIKDLTTNTVELVCSGWTTTTCSTAVGFSSGGAHTYVAYVDNSAGTARQATSNRVMVARKPWTITLSVAGTNATAVTNQYTIESKYRMWLWDETTNTSLGQFYNGTSTTWSISSTQASHVLVAYVASSYGPKSSNGDVQASSAAYSAATAPGVPAAQTFGCGCNTTVLREDPVNTATGAFSDRVRDLSFPGAGTTLDWTRTYTSADTTTGRLGPGWTDPYQSSLSIDAGTGNATVRAPDGARAVHTHNVDGTFTAPPGIRGTLAAVTGGYMLTAPDQHTVSFDSSGHLSAMRDAHGLGLAFTWSSGQMTTVTDNAGRDLDLSYDATSGRLTRLDLPDGRHVDYGYTSGRLTSVTDLGGQVWSYGYDSAGRLTTETDPRGHAKVTNVYDSGTGRVTSQTDALGAVTTFGWAAATQTATTTQPDAGVWTDVYMNNVLISSTDPLGNATSYGYDDRLNLTLVQDPAAGVTTYTYDSRGNRLSATPPAPLNAQVTHWAYDTDNNLTSVTDPLGHVTSFEYNSAGDRTEQTTPEGAVTTWTYNSDGTPATSVDPRGNATGATPADYRTLYGYDADANLTSITSPLGRQASFGYDISGRLTSATDPRGNASGATPADYTTTTTWTGRDQVHQVTDPLGHTTTSAYDAAGNLASVTDPLTHETTYGYDDANRLSTVTDPLGHDTTYTYNYAAQVTSATDADGNKTTHTYDKAGRLKTTTSPRGNATGATAADFTTTYSYDQLGNPISVAHPLPTGTATATTAYDALGRPTAVTDPGGKTTTVTYDAAGRTTTVTDPLSNATLTGYDDDGNVLTVTDPNQNTTTYTYDPAGLLTSRSDPLARTTAWTHDRDGLPATLTQPGSLVTTYGHDPAGNLTTVDHSDSATPDVGYSYDPAGRRDAMTDATGTSSYSYDEDGRPTAVTDGHGDTVGYGYDDAARLTDLDYPGTGRVATYTYTDAGRLATLTDWSTRQTSFTHNRDGQLTDIDYPNGVTSDQTYDIAGRLTAATTAKTTTNVLDLDYAYNTRGLLTDTDTTLAAVSSSSDYTWDDAARLDTGTDGDYTFDPADQLTRQAATTASYDDAGQLTTTTTGTADTDYTFDARGNRTGTTPDTGTATAYAYTQDNQLATYQRGTTDIAYTYDGDGLRTDTTTGTAPSATTEHFTWDTTGGLPLLLQDGDHTYLYGPDATPIAQIETATGDVEYLHHDLTGSTRALTDDTGQTVATRTYNPYGATTATTGTATSRFGYAGEYTEPATGLIYLRARHYDPTTGQFLTRDPLQDQTGSPYGYTSGDPLQETDPTGLMCITGHNADGSCRGSGVFNAAITSGVADHVAYGLTHGPGKYVASALEGIGDGASFGLTEHVREAISPGSNCYVDKNAAYWAGYVGGTAASTWASGGSRAAAGVAKGAAEDAIAGADFVASADGIVVSTSRSRLVQGFEDAGLPSRPTGSAGAEYTLPDGSLVRVMEPSGQAPLRASFTNSNGGPVSPFTGKPVQPPPGLSPAQRLDYVRARTHIALRS
jgi:RHS repeat-associated protein